jgi:hypothetical protein
MASFYLPYNFIPATGQVNGQQTPTVAYPKQESVPSELRAAARHDLWLKDRRHGRILCELTLKTPTVVGNEHQGQDPAQVFPYKVDGAPAIPANSLRGMIASVAETLSQSALRVLDHSYWNAFRKLGVDLPPWGRSRENLTPAELLFGVAEEILAGEPDEPPARNLGSRVRFYDGRIAPGTQPYPVLSEAEILLRPLGQPRPVEIPENSDGTQHNGNAPSLYFYRTSRAITCRRTKSRVSCRVMRPQNRMDESFISLMRTR